MATKARIKAQTKWEKSYYDSVLLRLRKDQEPTRSSISAFAESKGMSLNSFIVEAIEEKMLREGWRILK